MPKRPLAVKIEGFSVCDAFRMVLTLECRGERFSFDELSKLLSNKL